jgi:Ca2+-binding RTX toxin-like protein
VTLQQTGSGISAVSSWAGSYVLPDAIQNLVMNGDYGHAATGNAKANVITGAGGNDTLNGLAGNDRLVGGAGADTFVVKRGNGSDTIADMTAQDVVRLDGYGLKDFAAVKAAMAASGGNTMLTLGNGETLTFAGKAVADFTASQFQLVNVAATPTPTPTPTPDPTPTPVAQPFDLPVGGAPTNNVNGTSANNTLTGTAGNDRIDGKAGNDTMSGGAGDDTYVVDSKGGDVIVENANAGIDTAIVWAKSYTLAANVENMQLQGAYAHTANGNALDNLILGSNYADTINGGAGKDIIKGGLGADVLTGGAGNDIFVYTSLAEKGDVIKDFKQGEDLLDLRALMAEVNEFGDDLIASGIFKIAAHGNGSTAVQIDGDLDPTTAMETLVVLENILPTALKSADIVWQ